MESEFEAIFDLPKMPQDYSELSRSYTSICPRDYWYFLIYRNEGLQIGEKLCLLKYVSWKLSHMLELSDCHQLAFLLEWPQFSGSGVVQEGQCSSKALFVPSPAYWQVHKFPKEVTIFSTLVAKDGHWRIKIADFDIERPELASHHLLYQYIPMTSGQKCAGYISACNRHLSSANPMRLSFSVPGLHLYINSKIKRQRSNTFNTSCAYHNTLVLQPHWRGVCPFPKQSKPRTIISETDSLPFLKLR